MLILALLSFALQAAPDVSVLAHPPEPSLDNASSAHSAESNEAMACQRLTEELIKLDHDIVIVTTQKIFLEMATPSTSADLPDQQARHILGGALVEQLQSHAGRLEQGRAALKYSVWPLCQHIQFPASQTAKAHWLDRPD